MEQDAVKKDLTKLTKAELTEQLANLQEQYDDIIRKANKEIEESGKMVNDARRAVSEFETKQLAYADLIANLTDTNFEGLNETQINSKLIKRMMSLKYYFGK